MMELLCTGSFYCHMYIQGVSKFIIPLGKEVTQRDMPKIKVCPQWPLNTNSNDLEISRFDLQILGL